MAFAHAEHGQDLEGDSYDGEDVEDPTPCQVLSDISSEYRPDRRPEERQQSCNCKRLSSLRWGPDVSVDAAANLKTPSLDSVFHCSLGNEHLPRERHFHRSLKTISRLPLKIRCVQTPQQGSRHRTKSLRPEQRRNVHTARRVAPTIMAQNCIRVRILRDRAGAGCRFGLKVLSQWPPEQEPP